MESIKRGTTPTISAQVEGVEIDDIEKIEFIFKHIVSSRAAATLRTITCRLICRFMCGPDSVRGGMCA